MIYYFADNHFGSHAGRRIYEHLPVTQRAAIRFYEDDLSVLENGDWTKDAGLLILHLIGGSSGVAHARGEAEIALQRYLASGRNLLLLHGGSAAFWQWAWWRQAVGFRWVRPDDPDVPSPSWHPKHPFRVEPVGACELAAMEFPEDEIYANLAATAPLNVLMQTTIAEGTFAQVLQTPTAWGGSIWHFLPGHRPEVTADPTLIANVSKLIIAAESSLPQA